MHLTAAHKWRLFIFAGLAIFLLGASVLSAQEHDLTIGDYYESVPYDQSISKSAKSTIKYVRFVYLVPADSIEKPEYTLALENAARHLQLWFQRQLGNRFTFRLYPRVVQVIHTEHNSSWYSLNPNGSWGSQFYYNVSDDGFLYTGGRFWDPDNIWMFYIDAFNACGQAGGSAWRHCGVMSANDLRGFVDLPWIPICPDEGKFPYNECRYIGGMGHELGHALGLPHPPGCEEKLPSCDSDALMWLGYTTYPNTYFRAEEKTYLMNSPFIEEFQSLTCEFDCQDLVRKYVSSDNSHSASICEGDSILLGGGYQSTANVYVDTFVTTYGCDSIIITWLNVWPCHETTLELDMCQGDSVLLKGMYRKASGSYSDSLLNRFGCDSVIITNLQVHPSSEITRDTNICLGDSLLLGGKYRKASGTYMDSLLTANGCDSIITTHLATLALPEINLGNDTLLTTHDTLHLDAGNKDCEYSWCDGSSDKSLMVHDLDEGSHPYWVRVTDDNGCAQTDTILIQVIDATIIPPSVHMADGDIRVFPNPVDHTLHIEMTNISHCEYKIYSSEGMLVQTGNIHGPGAQIQLSDIQKGLYFLTIKSPEFSGIVKVVKW
jgi:hypothetical protein